MNKYKVVPTNIKTGSVAPYFVIEVDGIENVNKVAATLSPLFQFAQWEPSVSKLPNNPKKYNSKR